MNSSLPIKAEYGSGSSDFYTSFVNFKSVDVIPRVVEMMDMHGFVTFEGMQSPEDLLVLGQTLGKIIPHPDADSRGITVISPDSAYNNIPGKLGLTDHELKLHTDGTAVSRPADLLVLYCEKPATKGGETRLLDGKKLYDYLRVDEPDLLTTLTAPGSAAFGKLDAPYVGSIIEIEDNKIGIRFRADELGYYNGPIAINFEKLLTIMDRLATEFTLNKGQGYLINNRRAMHARNSFKGIRLMFRILIDTSGN